ncbi:MAG: hypothetical protein ACREEM_26255 [Blastocatellia bacterium]
MPAARAASRLPVGFLLLLPFLFFWRETLGLATLGDKDVIFWFYPAYKFVAEQLKQGNLPLLTPYLYCGAPLLAEWQAGVFDPINWLYLFGVTSRTLTLSLQLSFAIAMLAMFAYARGIGFKRRASVVAAVIYGLSGLTVGRTLYPGFLHIVALAPLVLVFVERLYRQGRWRDCAGGALVVAWQVFAAHPQPLIYLSLVVCAYVLFRLRIADCGLRNLCSLASFSAAIRNRIRFLIQCAVIYIAGAGLAAIQLLPTAELARESVRREWPYELFTLHSLHPVSLLTTLFPFFHGEGKTIYNVPYWGPYWHNGEAQIYLGVIALSLAAAGAVAAWRNRVSLARFWGLIAIAGVVLSLGKYLGPVARALFHVPIISQFRSPNRHWAAVTLAVAVLAGYAVDRLLREESKPIARWTQVAAASLALLCALVGGLVLWRRDWAERWIRSLDDLSQLPSGFLQHAGAEFYIPVIASLCGAIAVTGFARAGSRSRWYAVLLALLIVDFNLYATFAPINNPAKLEMLVGRAMPASLAANQSERNPIRYHLMLSPATGEFNPFWFYGHEMMTGYDPLLNQQVKDFLGVDEAGRTFNMTMLEPQDRTLDLLNVRYVFVPPVYFDSTAAKPGEAVEQIELPRGGRASFKASDAGGDQLTIVSSLSNSIEIRDGEVVAEITVACESGARWTTSLRAGIETAEWAYDRADVREAIKHARAKIAESRGGDARSSFEAHSYLARIALPENLKTCRGARTVEIAARLRDSAAITIHRAAFEDSRSRRSNALVRDIEGALGDADRWRELADRSEVPPYRDYRVYENLRAMPRAWLVDRVRTAWEGDQHKMIRGQIEGFDPREAALVEPIHEPELRWYRDFESKSEQEQGLVGTATIVERKPTRLVVETESDKAAVLVLSELAWPGWKMKVDGRQAAWYRVNFLLRAAPLFSGGRHRVEFVYDPHSLKIGAVVTLTTALGLLLLFLWERRKLRGAGAPV